MPTKRAARPPALLRGWLFFLVAALAVLAGSATHVATRPVTWSAQSVIAFVPVGERPVSATSVTLMVPRYVAYAASPYVVRQAAVSVGIPPAELEMIFEKFMQSSATRNASGGTGLGLSICRQIVRLHSGTVYALNNARGGATFVLIVPVQNHCREA